MEDSKVVNIGVTLQVIFQCIVLFLLQSHLKKSENRVLVIFVLMTVLMTILVGVFFLVIRYSRDKRTALNEKMRQCQFVEQLNHRYLIMESDLEAESVQLWSRLQKTLEETEKRVTELEYAQDNYHKKQKTLEIAGDAWSWEYCANAIANVVLSEKARECRERKIEFLVDTKIPIGISLSEYDMCSLFSNLLDNAIEACGSVGQTRREIRINANVQKQCFYLSVENSCTLEYAKRPRRYGHGLGLEIVKKIAEKYQGQIQVKTKEDWYRVEIIFSLEMQS